MENLVKLCLDEKYSGITLVIDMLTFTYYGPTLGYDHADAKDDSRITFRLSEADSTPENVAKVVHNLSNALKLNVEKAQYVHARVKFEDYEKDRRPVFSVRLSSGYRGMANPSQFSFKS
jgi:hypothetical protein